MLSTLFLKPQHSTPHVLSPDPQIYRIGRSMFETEVLPARLAKYTRLLDEVRAWLSLQHHKHRAALV